MEKALNDYFDERIENPNYRKNKQQGFSKNIKSWTNNGKRYIDVGGSPVEISHCLTFHDFLFFFFKMNFGADWLENANNNHPLKIWYTKTQAFIAQQETNSKGFYKASCTGAVNAILRLSYNLYLLAHNVELQKSLIKRLKQVEQFQGAYYETYVAAYLIYSGFKIEIENESDGSTKHQDYIIENPKTGVKYAVEVKLCSRENVLGSVAGNDSFKSVGDHLYGALSKPTKNKRIIFIEMNTDRNDWFKVVNEILDQKEQTLTINKNPAPSAYLFLTNTNYHYHEDDTGYSVNHIFTGFKIDDFHKNPQTYEEIIEQEISHIDCMELFTNMQNFEIPSTFNGENPNIEFSSNKTNGIIQEVINHQKNIGPKSAIEMYNFYLQSFRNVTKEKLLEFIDPKRFHRVLKDFSQERLAKLYCRLLSFYGRF